MTAIHFSWLDYGLFAAYLLATLAIGGLFFREQASLAEYFLAQRSMGRVVVAMTILASLFSGISFLAAPSEGYAHGITFYLVNIAFFVATPLTTLVILPSDHRAGRPGRLGRGRRGPGADLLRHPRLVPLVRDDRLPDDDVRRLPLQPPRAGPDIRAAQGPDLGRPRGGRGR